MVQDERISGKDISPDEQDRVTIRDVADAAGVSTSTVSRAFSRPGRVSARTVEKIQRIADELGYRSENLHAAGQPDHLNGLILIVVADLENAAFAQIVRSVQRECLRNGFGLLISDAEEAGSLERQQLRLSVPHVDGFIFASSRLSDSAVRKAAEIKPTVVLNRSVRGIQAVIADTMIGIKEAVRYAKELGHTTMTYLAGPAASWAEGVRWRALSGICTAQDIRLHRLDCGAPTFNGGYGAASAFVHSPTSSVLAYNDMLAVGFVAGLRRQGVRVPRDVSVIGMDDIPVASLVTPALTTISLPRRQLGERAAIEVISRIRHTNPDQIRPIMLPTSLVVRASTGPYRQGSFTL